MAPGKISCAPVAEQDPPVRVISDRTVFIASSTLLHSAIGFLRSVNLLSVLVQPLRYSDKPSGLTQLATWRDPAVSLNPGSLPSFVVKRSASTSIPVGVVDPAEGIGDRSPRNVRRKRVSIAFSPNRHLPVPALPGLNRSLPPRRHAPSMGRRMQRKFQTRDAHGTIHITVGTDNEPATAMWFYEPGPKEAAAYAGGKEKSAKASSSFTSTGKGGKGLPVLFDKDLEREVKYAKLWLTRRALWFPRKPRIRWTCNWKPSSIVAATAPSPRADINVGLEDSTNVILANLAMDEGRRVYMDEIEKLAGKPPVIETKKAAD